MMFGSLPANSKAAMKIARTWANVPEEMSDEDAMRMKFITPDMIVLIMSIMMDLFANCFSNRSQAAWSRVRGYVDSNRPLDKLGDTTRLQWCCNRWMNQTGFPRERGDVVELRKAIETEAASLRESDFEEIQTEQMFLTV